MSQCTTTVSNDAIPLQLPSRAQTLNSQAESVTKLGLRRCIASSQQFGLGTKLSEILPELFPYQSLFWTVNPFAPSAQQLSHETALNLQNLRSSTLGYNSL